MDRLERVGPTGTPRNSVGAMCDFPFLDPLVAEFEKAGFTKNVGLAMLYHVHFEKLEKVNFQAFYSNFRLVGALNNSVGDRTIFEVEF